MTGLRHSRAHSVHGAAPTSTPLAICYTQGITDGFGDRLLMSDNSSDSSLELLRFRPELARVPNFQITLRDTVARLVRFDQRLREISPLHVGTGVAVKAHRRHMEKHRPPRAARIIGRLARAGIGRNEIGAVALDIVEPGAVTELRLDPSRRRTRRTCLSRAAAAPRARALLQSARRPTP